MSDDNASYSENDINQNNLDSEDDFSDIDNDRPNLLQIEKKFSKYQKSLLKKRERDNGGKNDQTQMIYDSNIKTMLNCFCPNIEELSNFLEHCEIREINDEEILELCKKENKKNIFDPVEFMNKNIENFKNNNYLSVEDLTLFGKNKILENPEELKPIEESYTSEPKIEIKNELLKNILKNNILDINQKEELNKLISEIKNKNIKDIAKTDKLEIVFDLDNTCIFGFMAKPEDIKSLKEQYPQKELKSFKFLYQGKYLISGLIIRKGLLNFLEFANSFCNFYISTLGAQTYGIEIMSILEELNKNIKFKKFIGRKNENERRKFIKDIDIDNKKTLIFDDKPHVWIEDYLNVILSKKFSDKVCEKFLPKKVGLNSDDPLRFLYNYFPFYYYKSKKNDFEQIEWRNQKLIGDRIPPFYTFINENDTNNNCFSGEYLESSKYQFIYMKDIIKIIYYFVFYYDINVQDAIKLIRYNVFYNSYFNLKYYKGEKIILKEIILNCGGQIIETNKETKNNNKLFYICRKDDYSSSKEKIEKELMCYKESKVVTERYILDSFFFMTNLESEINDPDYSFDSDTNYDY